MSNFAASQVFRRPGMGVALALRRFRGEGGFKKIVFLYERTRHLYENKEGHVQNEAKTKLKTSRFLTGIAAKNTRICWFLEKKVSAMSKPIPAADCRFADG